MSDNRDLEFPYLFEADYPKSRNMAQMSNAELSAYIVVGCIVLGAVIWFCFWVLP